jgi:hypothetical protein
LRTLPLPAMIGVMPMPPRVSRPPDRRRRILAGGWAAALLGAAALSGCGSADGPAAGHAASPPAATSPDPAQAKAVRKLCDTGLHGDARVLRTQSAADVIAGSFTPTSLSEVVAGVTIAQLRQALLAGDAVIFVEHAHGPVKHVDGTPIPGPARISPGRGVRAGAEVDYFFTCGRPVSVTG